MTKNKIVTQHYINIEKILIDYVKILSNNDNIKDLNQGILILNQLIQTSWGVNMKTLQTSKELKKFLYNVKNLTQYLNEILESPKKYNTIEAETDVIKKRASFLNEILVQKKRLNILLNI